MIFTSDFVIRENHWQITPLVTKKSLFMVTHALFFISAIHSVYIVSLKCEAIKEIHNTSEQETSLQT